RYKVAQNILASESRVENNRIAYSRVADSDWPHLADALSRLSRLPLLIIDEPAKLNDVLSAVTKLALEHDCKVVAVDYLQLIEAHGENANREVTQISRALKTSFKHLNIAGVIAAQLNRGNETGGIRMPALRDLRD